MRSTYSYCGTSVLISIDDEIANNYNNAMKAWFAAQEELAKKLGRKLTPNDLPKLQIKATPAEFEAWNLIANFINKQIDNGLVIKEEEVTSNFLVKVK